MGHRRTPGVEHGGDADARAEVLRIGGDRQHRLRCRPEQQVVDQRLVVEGDVGDLGGQREHDVEVADRQQVGLALGQPGARRCALALGTVPVAAGVVGDPPMAAVLAGLDVTAERSGAAMLDRRHDLELVRGSGARHGRPDTLARQHGRCRRPRCEVRIGPQPSGASRPVEAVPSRSSGLMTARIVLVATWCRMRWC